MQIISNKISIYQQKWSFTSEGENILWLLVSHHFMAMVYLERSHRFVICPYIFNKFLKIVCEEVLVKLQTQRPTKMNFSTSIFQESY